MKFFAAVLLTTLLAFISGLFLPWWGIAIASLLVAILVHQQAGKAFLAGLLGVTLLWAGLVWIITIKNNNILAGKIATVLPLSGNTLLLILLTGFVGGLVSGFAAMTGSYLRASRRNSR